MTKSCIYLLIATLPFFAGACIEAPGKMQYRVDNKNDANFSVQFPELQPNEKILIRLNDTVILEDSTSIVKSGFWLYYRYPDPIEKIEFLDYWHGQLKIRKIYKDTLIDIKQRSLIVSRPFPKGMTKQNWRPYGFVSIDTGDRHVVLVNDAVVFKGLWSY